MALHVVLQSALSLHKAGQMPVACAMLVMVSRSLADVPAVQPEEKKSFVPSFIRNIMPGQLGLSDSESYRGTQNLPGANFLKKKDKVKEQELQLKEQEEKQFEQLVDMNLDGYATYCQQLLGQYETPPRPKFPPMTPRNPYWGFYVDYERTMYLRYQQHEKIIRLMTEEEKQHVLALEKEVLKDRPFLERIAERTGIYIYQEVKDCVDTFLTTRTRYNRVHRWVKEFGNPRPQSNEETEVVNTKMKEIEEKEEVEAALQKRTELGIAADLSLCPTLPKLAWVGETVICQVTNLPYWQCCGGNKKPKWLEIRERNARRNSEPKVKHHPAEYPDTVRLKNAAQKSRETPVFDHEDL